MIHVMGLEYVEWNSTSLVKIVFHGMTFPIRGQLENSACLRAMFQSKQCNATPSLVH